MRLKVAESKFTGSHRLQSAFCRNLEVAATIWIPLAGIHALGFHPTKLRQGRSPTCTES